MCCSPAETLRLSVLLLLIAALQTLKRLDVLDGFKCFVKVVHDVRDEGLDVLLHGEKKEKGSHQSVQYSYNTIVYLVRQLLLLKKNTYHFDKLEEFNDGRV